jgi:hypothetical protein
LLADTPPNGRRRHSWAAAGAARLFTVVGAGEPLHPPTRSGGAVVESDVRADTCRYVVMDEAADPFFGVQAACFRCERPWGGPLLGAAPFGGHLGGQAPAPSPVVPADLNRWAGRSGALVKRRRARERISWGMPGVWISGQQRTQAVAPGHPPLRFTLETLGAREPRQTGFPETENSQCSTTRPGTTNKVRSLDSSGQRRAAMTSLAARWPVSTAPFR